jgi:hypothetical protein
VHQHGFPFSKAAALHQRVVKTADTRGSTPGSNQPPNGTIDQRRLMFYSADWQLLEERIDDWMAEQRGKR